MDVEPEKVPMSRKLKWLTWMLWGGAILLAYEHVWHGEVVPWFPFLTAMSDPGDAAEMIHEMATVGVTMAVIITVTWFVMCKVSDAIMARDSAPETAGQDTEFQQQARCITPFYPSQKPAVIAGFCLRYEVIERQICGVRYSAVRGRN